MTDIRIFNPLYQDVTIISNAFLDQYMPQANGEFVKVYLYLLRTTAVPHESWNLSSLADSLNCTERDIQRALKYWEKAGILSLSFDEHKTITGVSFLNIENSKSEAASEIQESAPVASSIPVEKPESPREVPPVAAASAPKPKKRTTLTPDKVAQLKENEDVIQMLFIAEQYLGRTLSATDTGKLLYFFDELHFSVDLIEYLIDYCVSKGSKSMRYIETVAIAWADEQITTVAMAKKSTSRFHKNYYTIFKALGIKGHDPIDSEITLMDTWLNTYGFTMDLITLACSRTVMQTGKPSLQYVDKILADWHKNHVTSTNDVAILDEEHKKKTASRTPAAPKPKAKNSFNNFPQRQHDFEEYEKRLLNQ